MTNRITVQAGLHTHVVDDLLVVESVRADGGHSCELGGLRQRWSHRCGDGRCGNEPRGRGTSGGGSSTECAAKHDESSVSLVYVELVGVSGIADERLLCEGKEVKGGAGRCE